MTSGTGTRRAAPGHGIPRPGSPCATVHRAGWVIVEPGTIIENGYLVVENGRVTDVGHAGKTNRLTSVDHGSGVLLPALVNAHTHLELCALRGRVPFSGGFLNWVDTLLDQRAQLSPGELSREAGAGIEELKRTGCALVGDISTLGLTESHVMESKMAGIWFRECLGSELPPDLLEPTASGLLRKSLAGHAPHSTAPEVLTSLKQATRTAGLPFSIHVAESDAEQDFITTGTGKWADFLAARGIDFSGWNVPARSAVHYLDCLDLLGCRTLAVHLLWTDRRDLERLARTGTEVCLCPRSNRNLHGRLPDVTGMLDCGIRPCLGTDSLASTETLSVFDEMVYLGEAFPEISPETVLQMATVNGARALGLSDHYGDLIPGKIARFTYMPIQAKSSAEVLETLVRQPVEPVWDP